MVRQRSTRRHPPWWRRRRRTLAVLAAAVAAIVVVLAIHHRSGPDEPPPVISERQRLLLAAEAALRTDPSIADVIYTAAPDRWDVTPAIAGSDPRSFARYVCFVIGAHGVMLPGTSVRVIDGAVLETNGFDYNAASRGVLTCNERT